MSAPVLRRMSLIATLTLLSAIGVNCTVTRTIVRNKEIAFVGSQQDGGFRGWYTNSQGAVYAVMAPEAAAKYNGLIDRYGATHLPPYTHNAGLAPFTNDTWLIDAEHDVWFREMNRRENSIPAP